MGKIEADPQKPTPGEDGNQVDDPKAGQGASAGSGEGEPNPGSKEGGDSGTGEPDKSKWDEGTRKYIEKLRKEAGGYRNELKGVKERLTKFESAFKGLTGEGDDEDDDPQVTIQSLSSHLEDSQTEIAFLREANRRGLDDRQTRMAQVIFDEKVAVLGDEPSDDDVDDAWDAAFDEASQYQKAGSGRGKGTSTSVDNQKGSGDGGNKAGGGITAEQFAVMSQSQKAELRAKSPEAYDQLFREANSKGLLFKNLRR